MKERLKRLTLQRYFLCHLVWKLVLRELPLDSEISLHQLRYLHYREKEYAMLGGLSLPFAQMAVSLGMSPVTACMLLLYSCEVLFFPYESAGNLIMYEFGMMSMGRFVKEMTLKAVIMIVGFVVVMYPMWKLMGFL